MSRSADATANRGVCVGFNPTSQEPVCFDVVGHGVRRLAPMWFPHPPEPRSLIIGDPGRSMRNGDQR